ncbi:MAG: hypothetical protein DYG89_48875 [Caldilinea sp. CFX5]|nr:hypothetical protein [Caldilinea sp. CFX5]
MSLPKPAFRSISPLPIKSLVDTTPRFQLPADLRQRLQPPLAAQFAGTARPRRPITPVPAQPPPLLHDLAQWLIYLHQEQELVLQSR